MFLSDEGPSLETLYLAFYVCSTPEIVSLWRRAFARNVRLYYIRIGSTPTFLYYELALYLNTAYAAHYVVVYNAIRSF